MNENRKVALAKVAAIFLLAMFVYIPAMQAEWIWDDNLLITQFPVIHHKDALKFFWWPPSLTDGMTVPDYFPIYYTALWAEIQVFKDNVHPAMGFHVVMVMLHALGSVLVWRVLRRLAVPASFLAGLVFAVHPVNVSSVAWVSELKNTLSIIFFLLTILWYLRHEEGRRWWWYAAAMAVFVAAMLTKASVSMLPVALLLCVWWRRKRKMATAEGFLDRLLKIDLQQSPSRLLTIRLAAANLIRTVPFFLVAAGLSVLTIYFQQKYAIGDEEILKPGTAEGTFPWRLAMAGCAPWFYLYKDLVPINLLMIYKRWSIDTANFWWYVPGVCILAVAAALFFLRRRSWAQAAIFALGYFLVMLFPVLGFFNMFFFVHSLVADHWQYLSIIGVIALVVGGAWHYCSRWAMPRRSLPIAVAAAVVTALGLATWQQTLHYQDQVALWRFNLPQNPDAWMGQYNLGTCLSENALNEQDFKVRQNLLEQAVPHLLKAAELRPKDSSIRNNLGLTLMHLKRFQESIESFRKALETNPNNVQAHINLGLALREQQRLGEAYDEFCAAIKIQPQYHETYLQKGAVLLQMGRYQEAVETFSILLELNRGYADGYYNRGLALLSLKRTAQAKADFEKALELQFNHNPAMYQLSLILDGEGKTDQAIELLFKSVTYNASFVEGRAQLAFLLDKAGRLNEAVIQASTVVQQSPDSAKAHGLGGYLLAKAGVVGKSIAHYRRALELQGDATDYMNDLARVLISPVAGTLRNVDEGIAWAQKACRISNPPQPSLLETLAAAYAEAGRFDEAVGAEQKALELVSRSADKTKIETVQKLLREYRSRRDASPPGAAGQKPSSQE